MAHDIGGIESEKVKSFLVEPSNSVFLSLTKIELKQLVVFWGGTPTSSLNKAELRGMALLLAAEQNVELEVKPASDPGSGSESGSERGQIKLEQMKYDLEMKKLQLEELRMKQQAELELKRQELEYEKLRIEEGKTQANLALERDQLKMQTSRVKFGSSHDNIRLFVI